MQQQPSTTVSLSKAWERIINFYGENTLAEVLQQVEKLVHAACSDKRPRRSSGQLLFVVQQLQEIVAAALTIQSQQGWHSDAIVKAPDKAIPVIHETQQYVSKQLEGNAWDCFPRHLSSRQYHNPYRVFKKLANSMAADEWKQMLQDLLEYAMMKATITDAHSASTILMVQKRLCQLLEAGHLLAVRVAKHTIISPAGC